MLGRVELVLANVVFGLVCVVLLPLRHILLWGREAQGCRPEVRDSSFDQGSQALEMVKQIIPEVVLHTKIYTL